MINRRHVINDNEIDSPPPLGVVTACELLSFGISTILSYIVLYIKCRFNALAYTLSNTWQNLINYLSWQKMS